MKDTAVRYPIPKWTAHQSRWRGQKNVAAAAAGSRCDAAAQFWFEMMRIIVEPEEASNEIGE